MHGMVERIKRLIERVVEENQALLDSGIYLVDIIIRGAAKNIKIEVLADTDQGISIGQCSQLARLIRDRLEIDEDHPMVLGEDYELVVSSPGVGEVIRQKRQYIRHIGRLLKITYVDADGEQVEISGRLVEAEINGAEPFIAVEPRIAAKLKKNMPNGQLTLRLGDIVRASVQFEI
jgi:ribosome maturation factor RimP